MKEKLFIESIYSKFGVTKIKDTRLRDVLVVRQAMYIYLFNHAEMSYLSISKMLGVTHATVLNGVKRYYEYIRTDRGYKKKTDEIIDYCDDRYNFIFHNKEYRLKKICYDLEQRIFGMRIAGADTTIFENRLLKLKQNER